MVQVEEVEGYIIRGRRERTEACVSGLLCGTGAADAMWVRFARSDEAMR